MAEKPGNWKNLEFDNLGKKKTGKAWNFEQKSLKNLSSSKNFFFKNTFKVAIQYLFIVLLVFNIIFYLKLYFKLKIDPKMCSFNNLEEILKNLLATMKYVNCKKKIISVY